MANWGNLGSRGRVQDRRAMGPSMIGGGLGIGGLLVVLALNYLGGGDVIDVLNQIDTSGVLQPAVTDTGEFEGADEYEVFASTVLGSSTDTWTELFAERGETYTEPTLVLFRGSTPSACGGATSDVGPHYCPVDGTIYLDETFFEELQNRFNAQGGDVAEAYVIAHEVGHHVQSLEGTLNGARTNAASVEVELQADCYAGIWFNSIRDLGVLEANEIREALDAAAAVGDDRIQQATTGRIHPETWTHGSSDSRVAAFTEGYNTGECEGI